MSSFDIGPNGYTPDMHSSQKRGRVFRIPCGNPTPTLQFQKDIFYKVPKLIKIFIIMTHIFATFTRGNDRVDSSLLDRINQSITIISFVCQKILSVYSFDKPASLRTICNGTCCNKHSDRHTMRIHGQMYLGVEPPFVRPIS